MEYINGSDLSGKRFVKLENGDLREVKKGKFIPEKDEDYWFVSHFGNIHSTTFRDSDMDRWFIKHNPVFHTKEEAEEYKHYLEVLDQYSFKPNLDDIRRENWYLIYSCLSGKKVIAVHDMFNRSLLSYFPTKESAEAFIDEVGEDAVKRFMFDIWE